MSSSRITSELKKRERVNDITQMPGFDLAPDELALFLDTQKAIEQSEAEKKAKVEAVEAPRAAPVAPFFFVLGMPVYLPKDLQAANGKPNVSPN